MERAEALLSDGGSGNLLPPQGERTVSVENLIADPADERKNRGEREVEEMAQSIRENGIYENITASPVGGGRYMVIAGHTRLEGAKRAGLKEVTITVRTPKSDAERRRQSLVTNIIRNDLNAVDLAAGLRDYLELDATITTQQDLADKIGKSKQWVSDMMKILDLPDPLRERVRTSVLPIGADSLFRIAREEDRSLQAELVEAVIGGATNHEIRSRIAERKGKSTDATSTKAGVAGADSSATEKLATKTVVYVASVPDAYLIIQPRTSRPLTREQKIDLLRGAIRKIKSDANEDSPQQNGQPHSESQ